MEMLRFPGTCGYYERGLMRQGSCLDLSVRHPTSGHVPLFRLTSPRQTHLGPWSVLSTGVGPSQKSLDHVDR